MSLILWPTNYLIDLKIIIGLTDGRPVSTSDVMIKIEDYITLENSYKIGK
jgi:hypothetical protein